MTRAESLAAARKLLRTFASAPDARRRAQAFFQTLSRCRALSPAEQGQVDALGQWLADKPSTAQLKARCEEVLTRLG